MASVNIDPSDLVGDSETTLVLAEFGEDPELPQARIFIAGLQYYDYNAVDDILGRIRPKRGDRLQLVRQPENPYDGNAVEVWWRNGRLQLGHLPRDVATKVAPLIDAGDAIRCYAVNSGNGESWSVQALLISEHLPEELSGG
ncbi:HIRAN domain-containing protein [Tropicimonas sp. IMCC6043]|uniref:HIRAN domain-containing protein n=1 Tax=Tropicimonas sp. IMCC6043 TaxID=2510645 RepID=UPI00101D3558|nr:HIRAN domain-containing protein [Tropicimonas sp. IMCC6043]RYH06525.1 hypothetical protein EU800_23590 [Tropicimonas sp. IMCC6043]